MPKVYGFLWWLCYILVQFPPYSRVQDWNISQMHSYIAGKINALAGCTLESWLATCSVSTAMSAPKRRRFLSPTKISEMVRESESEGDTVASSVSTSEDEGGLQDKPGVSHLQLDRPTSGGQASSSSIEKCFWSYSDWIKSAVDTALWPSDRCSSHLYRGPQV